MAVVVINDEADHETLASIAITNLRTHIVASSCCPSVDDELEAALLLRHEREHVLIARL